MTDLGSSAFPAALIVPIWPINPGNGGCRPLIFHVDGGWNTEQSQKNVENLAA